jgi:hypothetical protein
MQDLEAVVPKRILSGRKPSEFKPAVSRKEGNYSLPIEEIPCSTHLLLPRYL